MDNDKLKSMFTSRRFWAAVAGVAIVFAEDMGYSIDPETVTNIVILAGTWILGDSMRKTEVK